MTNIIQFTIEKFNHQITQFSKNSTIKEVNFSNIEITDIDTSTTILNSFSKILDNLNLETVILQNNNIDTFDELFHKVNQHTKLILLDLSGNKEICNHIDSLKILDKRIHSLDIKFCDCGLDLKQKGKDNQTLYEIIETLREKNINIWLNYSQKQLNDIIQKIKINPRDVFKKIPSSYSSSNDSNEKILKEKQQNNFDSILRELGYSGFDSILRKLGYSGFDSILRELGYSGIKTSHWIWYVFPTTRKGQSEDYPKSNIRKERHYDYINNLAKNEPDLLRKWTTIFKKLKILPKIDYGRVKKFYQEWNDFLESDNGNENKLIMDFKNTIKRKRNVFEFS